MATLPKSYPVMEHLIKHCMELCQQCHNLCLGVHSYGLQRKLLSENTTRLLQDCAEICQTSANFLLRGSEFHAQTCGICAEICLQCATACEAFPEDSRLQECARICRKCAESCHAMLAMTVAG